MGIFLRPLECQGPKASIAGAGALDVLGDMVVPKAEDASGVCCAVTSVFCGTTLAGIVGEVLGVTGVTMHGAAGTAGPAVVSSRIGVTHSVLWLVLLWCSFRWKLVCWIYHHSGWWWGMSCADSGIWQFQGNESSQSFHFFILGDTSGMNLLPTH